MKLFRIVLRVTPTPDHPLFFRMKLGSLAIWLYATSHEDAIERAKLIIEQLPFDIAAEEAEATENPVSTDPTIRGKETAASEVGLGIFLLAEEYPSAKDDHSCHTDD